MSKSHRCSLPSNSCGRGSSGQSDPSKPSGVNRLGAAVRLCHSAFAIRFGERRGASTSWRYCHVPYACAVGKIERIEAQVERFASGFKRHVIGRSIISPSDLERHYANLCESDISGGPLDLGRLRHRWHSTNTEFPVFPDSHLLFKTCRYPAIYGIGLVHRGPGFQTGPLTADIMTTILTWHDIVFRLLATTLAAGIIGFNRDERGHSAGLRTNLLVALAACIAMIQTNMLINSTGKPSDSFVVMDIMRLPLGILSGIGFIGAGAIIKRGEMIVGLTTAATLWFVTVMGLCFGGGQLALGLAAFALGFGILSGLKQIEHGMPREQSGTLRIRVTNDGPDETEIESLLRSAGIFVTNLSLTYESSTAGSRAFGWKIRWKGQRQDTNPPSIIQELVKHPDIQRLEFTR